MAIEIFDLPSYERLMFHSLFGNIYQRVSELWLCQHFPTYPCICIAQQSGRKPPPGHQLFGRPGRSISATESRASGIGAGGGDLPFLLTQPRSFKAIVRSSIWRFPQLGVPQNGWFTMENVIKKDDDWGYPYDSGNPLFLMILCWISNVFFFSVNSGDISLSTS